MVSTCWSRQATSLHGRRRLTTRQARLHFMDSSLTRNENTNEAKGEQRLARRRWEFEHACIAAVRDGEMQNDMPRWADSAYPFRLEGVCQWMSGDGYSDWRVESDGSVVEWSGDRLLRMMSVRKTPFQKANSNRKQQRYDNAFKFLFKKVVAFLFEQTFKLMTFS